MMPGDPVVPDQRWRAEMLSLLAGQRVDLATDALLSLTFNDPDGAWVEQVILNCLDGDSGIQVKQLAITCIGHIARIHGKIANRSIIERLHQMAGDPDFSGRAQDALDDISAYLGRG